MRATHGRLPLIHRMEEADRLARRVAIVDSGKIVAEGAPDQLKGELSGDTIHLELEEAGTEGQPRRLLENLDGIQEVVVEGKSVRARSALGAQPDWGLIAGNLTILFLFTIASVALAMRALRTYQRSA